MENRHSKEEMTYFGDIRTKPVTTKYEEGWERIYGDDNKDEYERP